MNVSKRARLDAADAEDYVFSDQIGHLLRRAYQRHLAIFQANTAGLNLTSTQFVTLCALRDSGPCSQTDLIEATRIDQATIRGIIERLGKRTLIGFQADPTDRRKMIVVITASGLALVEQMTVRAKQISELTMGELNPAERLAITFVLRKMTALQPKA